MWEWRWKTFKEEESVEILKILGLFKICKGTKWIYDYFEKIVQANIGQKFRLKNIDGTSYLTEEIDQYDLMSKKHKNVYTILNYTGKFLISTMQLLNVFQSRFLILYLVFL